jgi:sarcosine oxidase subunit alpha
VSGGWNPAVHLHSQTGGRLRHDDAAVAFVPEPAVSHEVVGAAAGLLPDEDEVPPAALWSVPDPGDGEPWDTHFVDLQRDATIADVIRAARAGMRSVEHVKRYTTIGTAHDQGKTGGILAIGVIAEALGTPVGELGTTTFRAPYAPVSFVALAGRDRGRLHDPVRGTPLHAWHVAHGAEFEDVGQWKRPRYFPAPGEHMDAAVARECRAARSGVAMMDASTLGKIDVQGPDAAAFLDRIYTNMISTVPVGGIRYGLMCRPDGMVFDDGIAIRLAEDRYLLTASTGNAAAVLEWLEEWLQTEWPDLRVHCTSVTDHWATIALVGPRSRDVLARVAPALAVANDDFPFMTWREAEVAGIAARVCRISFSGELAYEINVVGWNGRTVGEALLEAGSDLGITPYGTEAMHVLRAEKGYPIIGQDTDGTVTPQDLGMDWVVSRKKEDFIGKRSFARPDTRRPDRKHLVGLLPADPALVLREGTQLVATTELRAPVPMLGHVTSSYRSDALGRSFALALLKSGRERHGETVHAVVGDRAVAVTVTGPVFYDPEGRRRDG